VKFSSPEADHSCGLVLPLQPVPSWRGSFEHKRVTRVI